MRKFFIHINVRGNDDGSDMVCDAMVVAAW